MSHRHLGLAILCSALILPPTLPAAGGDPAVFRKQVVDLERVIALAEELRPLIDRSSFEVQALIDRLDYDAAEIIRFVRQDIAFQQYPGVLRGAKGTLMAQAGNALDQSILLATLLRDAGYDAASLPPR